MGSEMGRRRTAQRVSSRNITITTNGASHAVTLPSLVEDTDFPYECGRKLKPFIIEMEDPETGEKCPAIVYFPREE